MPSNLNETVQDMRSQSFDYPSIGWTLELQFLSRNGTDGMHAFSFTGAILVPSWQCCAAIERLRVSTESFVCRYLQCIIDQSTIKRSG